jgi:hypothetical protein
VRDLALAPANGCRRCGQDFGSVSAFDAHFENPAAPRSLDGTEGGFVCLVGDELKAKGMHRDKFGRWRKDGTSLSPFVTGVRRDPELWSAKRGLVAA